MQSPDGADLYAAQLALHFRSGPDHAELLPPESGWPTSPASVAAAKAVSAAYMLGLVVLMSRHVASPAHKARSDRFEENATALVHALMACPFDSESCIARHRSTWLEAKQWRVKSAEHEAASSLDAWSEWEGLPSFNGVTVLRRSKVFIS